MLRAQIEFQKRYYQWSLQNWEKEIREDFQLLRTINSPMAQRPLRVMESLSTQDRHDMAITLVKRRTIPSVLDKFNESFSSQDKQRLEKFMQLWDEESVKEALNWSRYYATQKRTHRIKSKLTKAITSSLKQILGEEYEDWGGGEWRYRTDIGPWRVITHIDTSGQSCQLYYHHDICAAEHVYLSENISILNWLGISSETEWTRLSNSDIEPTSQALTTIIKYFMDAAPKLLEGLTPELIEKEVDYKAKQLNQ